MPLLQSLSMGIRALLSKRRQNQELDEELESFLDAAIADKVRAGQTNQQAARAARVEMGSREAVKEQVRAVGWETTVENIWRDFRFSLRMLAKSPGFSAVAILSLALGIGANTAIFTLINGLMLKSLPVRDPQQLVSFGTQVGGGQVDGIGPGPLDLFPYDFYQTIQGPNRLLSGISAYASFHTVVSFRVSTNATQSAAQALSHVVSGNFFQILGAEPMLGRTLLPSDSEAPGREPVAVISHRFWRDRLASAPSAVGQTISLNGTTFTIVGVMPANFSGVSVSDDVPDFWVPLTMQSEVMLQPSMLGPHALYWLHFMGRRNSGVPFAQVRTWITSQLHRYMLQREGPIVDAARQREIKGIFVEALAGDRGISNLRAQYSDPLKILMGIVALVLLIACANLANFLLARAASREREISTRLALGSGRARIIRQFILEAFVIALAGGALGLLLSYAGTRVLLRFVASGARQTALSSAPDAHVLLFTLGVSLLTGLLFGVAPALRVSRLSLAPAATASVRHDASAGGRSGRRMPKLLIALQVMLSLMLLASAGLFARTLHNLQTRDFGFNRSGVLLVRFNAKFAGYKPEQLNSLYHRMVDNVMSVPGVHSASISGAPPISGGNWDSPITFKGNVTPRKDTSTLLNRVGPGYFETVSIPLERGRTIEPRDTDNALKVVVVNQAFANYFFPRGDAIGHTFTVADPSVKGEFQIIGVVRNSKYQTAREEPQRMAYLPVQQLTGDDAYSYVLEVQTAREPANVLAGVRRALAAVDPNLPLLDVNTLAEQTDRQMANEILISRLSAIFSLLALFLASIGLYGVMTYNVLRRSAEIGIRMTLGAPARRVLWMVLQESLVLLAVGIAAGLPASLAVTRIFQSQLFGLSPSDPLTFGTAILILSAVVLTSAFFPARKATHVDPMVTLRAQ